MANLQYNEEILFNIMGSLPFIIGQLEACSEKAYQFAQQINEGEIYQGAASNDLVTTYLVLDKHFKSLNNLYLIALRFAAIAFTEMNETDSSLASAMS